MLRVAVATAWRNVTHADAGTVKIAKAFKVSRAAVVVNVEKVANVDGAADAAKVEPRDDLRDVFERLQVYWRRGSAR